MKPKLTAALLIYVALATGAGFVLDGKARLMVWLILGYFAFRTVLASIRQDLD